MFARIDIRFWNSDIEFPALDAERARGSDRNADYETGAGIEPALRAQFHHLEETLAAIVVVWPTIELEAA